MEKKIEKYVILDMKRGTEKKPMFWKSNDRGYVSNISNAKMFTKEEAQEIVSRPNSTKVSAPASKYLITEEFNSAEELLSALSADYDILIVLNDSTIIEWQCGEETDRYTSLQEFKREVFETEYADEDFSNMYIVNNEYISLIKEAYPTVVTMYFGEC